MFRRDARLAAGQPACGVLERPRAWSRAAAWWSPLPSSPSRRERARRVSASRDDARGLNTCASRSGRLVAMLAAEAPLRPARALSSRGRRRRDGCWSPPNQPLQPTGRAVSVPTPRLGRPRPAAEGQRVRLRVHSAYSALWPLLLLAASACATREQPSDAAGIARVIEGTWSTSAAVTAAHAPGESAPDIPEHAITFTIDPRATEGVPAEQLAGLQIVCCGHMGGGNKPHRFFLGSYGDRAYLLLLSEGMTGSPFGDSDGGFVSLRPGGGQSPDVLLIELDTADERWVAYERS